MMRAILAAALAALMAGSAQAADKESCAAAMICASAPQSVVDALQKAGYKAVLTNSETTGNPMIESAANGYNFHIFFYECEEKKNCASLQFSIAFAGEEANTPQLANMWNKKMRFMQMSVDDQKVLSVSYDLSTIGGLNQKNFADVAEWWVYMLGELNKFFKEHPAET